MPLPAINLLPPELRPRRSAANRALAYAAAVALVLVLLAIYDARLLGQAGQLQQQAATMQAEARSLKPAVDRMQALQAEEAALRNRQARYQGLRRSSWNRVWRDLMAAVPAGVEVRSVATEEGGLTLAGVSGSLTVLSQAEERLAAVPGVRQVDVVSAQADGAGRVAFSLKVFLSGASLPAEGRATP